MTDNTCPICYSEFGDDVSTTKCGHKFCTGCLLNCMAKNTGNEEGSNRTKCPICRADMIEGGVEPSFKVTTRLDDLTNEVNSLKRDNLMNMKKVQFYEFNWNKLSLQFKILKENYRKSEFTSLMRKNTLLKFHRISAIKIQKWSRMILVKRKLTSLKHRNAWKIYKSIIEKCYSPDIMKIIYNP